MISRKRLAWLLWFALLLPFAQLAAAAHELGHLPAVAAAAKAKSVPASCEVCLVAAAIGTGGAPSTPQLLPAVPPQSAAPVLAPAPRPHAAFVAHFHSRAPPSA